MDIEGGEYGIWEVSYNILDPTHTRNNQTDWNYKCCDVVTFQSLIVEIDSSRVSVV